MNTQTQADARRATNAEQNDADYIAEHNARMLADAANDPSVGLLMRNGRLVKYRTEPVE